MTKKFECLCLRFIAKLKFHESKLCFYEGIVRVVRLVGEVGRSAICDSQYKEKTFLKKKCFIQGGFRNAEISVTYYLNAAFGVAVVCDAICGYSPLCHIFCIKEFFLSCWLSHIAVPP